MRASCVLLLLVAACGSETPPPAAPSDGSNNPTFVGTGTNGGSSSGTGGQGGEAGSGGTGGAAGAEGACSNQGDVEAFSFAPSGREVARRCVVSRCGSFALDPARYADCVSGCATNDVLGLSRSCAECYGDLSRCELENACASSCRINVCTSECEGCLQNAGCLSALDECTGVPDDACLP